MSTATVSSMTPADTGTPSRTPGRSAGSLGRRRLAMQLGAAVVLFGSWELAARLGIVDEHFTSRPSQFMGALVRGFDDGVYWPLLTTTLFEVFAGYLVAVALGLIAGFAIAESRTLDVVAGPFLVGFNNIPRIALAPLFVLWFGLGSMSRIVLVASMAFFIVAFSTKAGIQAADRDHLLLAKTLGASRRERFVKFVLPAALPATFAGIQLALTYSFMGAVAGEMLSGNQGLGGYLALTMNTFDTENFFGALFALVLVSLFFSGALGMVERRLLRWRRIEMKGIEAA